MDASMLVKLGKVAGVPGIALGVAALVLSAVAEGTSVVPEAWRGPVTMALVVGGVLIGVVGMLLWGFSKSVGAQIAETEGDDSPALTFDKTRSGGRQRASTKGDRSPATSRRE